MTLSVGAAWALISAAAHGQTLFDTTLAADLVADGLGGSVGTLTTAIVFVGDDTLLAVNRGDAKVYRIDLELGVVVQPGPVVLDLNVISSGGAPQSEYGVQAMEIHPAFVDNGYVYIRYDNGYVYIRYDKSVTPGVDTPEEEVVLGPNFSASVPTKNVIERYVWDPAVCMRIMASCAG